MDPWVKSLQKYPTPSKSKNKDTKSTPKKKRTLSQSPKKSVNRSPFKPIIYSTPQRENKQDKRNFIKENRKISPPTWQNRPQNSNRSPQEFKNELQKNETNRQGPKITQQHIKADKNTQENRNQSANSQLQKNSMKRSQNSSNIQQRNSRSPYKPPIEKMSQQNSEKKHEKGSIIHSSPSPQKQQTMSPPSYANELKNKIQSKQAKSQKSNQKQSKQGVPNKYLPNYNDLLETSEKEQANQMERQPEERQKKQFNNELLQDHNEQKNQPKLVQVKNEYIDYGQIKSKEKVPYKDYINKNHTFQFKQDQQKKLQDSPKKSDIPRLIQNITDNQSRNQQNSNQNQHKNQNQNITLNSKFVNTEYNNQPKLEQVNDEYIDYVQIKSKKMDPYKNYINKNQTFQFKQDQQKKLQDSPKKSDIPRLIQNITDNQSQNQQNSNQNKNQNQNITPNSKFVHTEYNAHLNLQRDSYKKTIDSQNNQQIPIKVQKVDQNEERLKQNYKELEIGSQERNSKKLDRTKVEIIKQESIQPEIQDLNFNQFQQTTSQIPQVEQNTINNRHKNQKLLICNLDHCDYIELQSYNGNPNIYFVLSKFAVYIGEFNKETSSKEGYGLILQRYFDKDFNSQYFQYQGEFRNDQIVGRGKLFNQKSKQILQEGEWSSIQKTLNQYPNIAIKPRISKIKILNVSNLQDGVQRKRVFDSKETTAFHDQFLFEQDLTVLQKSVPLTSSTIDAYIEHLNYEDERQYWSLNIEERKQYKRLYIFPIWFFYQYQNTNSKNSSLFKEHFPQFEPIQFRIWQIYERIAFVINPSNAHWYLVQLDFQNMEILIKDSKRGSQEDYSSTVESMQNIFQEIYEKIQFKLKICQDFQKFNFDCGEYTCMNLKALAEGKLEDINDGIKIRQLLLNMLIYKN